MTFVQPIPKKRASLGTIIESAMGHKSIKEVYASRKVPTHLSGTERNIVVNDPRLKVQSRGGGWARVTYIDPEAKGPVTFSIRMKKIEGVMNKLPSKYSNPAEAVYSVWKNTTTRGAKYSSRRQVEGMLKTAIKKNDYEMAEKLQYILGLSDDKVDQFWKDWSSSHTAEEISDWFDYEDEEEWV